MSLWSSEDVGLTVSWLWAVSRSGQFGKFGRHAGRVQEMFGFSACGERTNLGTKPVDLTCLLNPTGLSLGTCVAVWEIYPETQN